MAAVNLSPFQNKQYSKRYLEELLPHAKIVPAVNQIENHPQLPQQEIVDFCKEKGIHIMAYSPFGSTGSPVTSAEPVIKIAEKHGVKPTTVLLSYHRKFIPCHYPGFRESDVAWGNYTQREQKC